MATIRDYTVTYVDSSNTVMVEATSKNNVLYSALPTLNELQELYPEMVEYKLTACFEDCVNLIRSPAIPQGVTGMAQCFARCVSLLDSPLIPAGVTRMNNCFNDCTSLATASDIPSSVTTMSHCFRSCSNLTGRIRIDGSPSGYDGCFRYTVLPIEIYGRSSKLNQLAATSSSQNVTVFVPQRTWSTPVTNRVSGSRTNYVDINRIADNLAVCGGFPRKFDYVATDFVTDTEWKTIIDDTNYIANTLGIQRATESTSYTNLNRIENIHKLYHESLSE